MKKHKSVVAILLAVMMIFTMMPTMAFAAKATGWDAANDYATVQDASGDSYVATRTWSADGNAALIKATATAKKVGQAVGESDGVAPSVSDTDTTPATKYFYQLDGSALVYENDAKNTLDGATVAYSWFKSIESKVQVKVNKPSYVEGYVATATDNFAVVGLGQFKGWTAKLKTSEYDETKKSEDQKITVSIEWTPDGEVDGTLGAPEKMGVVATATITVKGTPLAPSQAKFYFDTVGGLASNAGIYDGSAHTVVCDEVPGYTVSYEVYNEATGKWDAVSAVSITDIPDKPISARATFKKGSESVPVSFTVDLLPAGEAKVGFVESEEGYYSVSGTTYDAASYIVATAGVTYNKNLPTDEAKKAAKALDNATAKAVEANKADLIAYFNDYYEITAEASKSNPNAVTLTIESKDLSSTETTALTKKYKKLTDSFSTITIVDKSTALVALNGVDMSDTEIEFTVAPAKKVFHVKKAKKLKKTQSFSVKAECKNGTIVKYKLINAPKKSISINANTGKITVKKGLAKGTYTFKVKAYISGSSNMFNHEPVSELQTIKVVVKK